MRSPQSSVRWKWRKTQVHFDPTTPRCPPVFSRKSSVSYDASNAETNSLLFHSPLPYSFVHLNLNLHFSPFISSEVFERAIHISACGTRQKKQKESRRRGTQFREAIWVSRLWRCGKNTGVKIKGAAKEVTEKKQNITRGGGLYDVNEIGRLKGFLISIFLEAPPLMFKTGPQIKRRKDGGVVTCNLNFEREQFQGSVS